MLFILNRKEVADWKSATSAFHYLGKIMKNTKKTDKGKNFIHLQLYQITINLTSATKEYKEPFDKKLYKNYKYSILNLLIAICIIFLLHDTYCLVKH